MHTQNERHHESDGAHGSLTTPGRKQGPNPSPRSPEVN
jgi:hypothetical protein